MISLVIDSNIFFSAIYNEKGLERKILDLSIEKDEIQIFAPDIFWEEVIRVLIEKLSYTEEEVEQLISKFDIIEIPQNKYENFKDQAETMISHKSDAAFVSTSLFLNCPIWSGNVKHFQHIRNSKEIIWLTSRELLDYLKKRDIISNNFD